MAEPKSILKPSRPVTPEKDDRSDDSSSDSDSDVAPPPPPMPQPTSPLSPPDKKLTQVEMNIGNYKAEHTIGYGNSAQVIKAKNAKDSEVYALKRLRGVKRAPERGRRMIVSEVRMMSKVTDHPYIVNLKEAMYDEEGDDAYIAMEYADGGTLKERCKAGPLPEDKLLHYFVQICLAVKHLHENKILHRDLKSDNIYLTKDDRIKVGDFGVARELDPMDFAKTLCGTPHYMSPEAMTGKNYTTKTDMWSLGVIIYEMATGGRMPFPATTNLETLIQQQAYQKHPPLPAGYSRGLSDIYDALLQKKPENRPSINEVLGHPTMYAAFELLPHEEVKGLFSKRGTLKPRREAIAGRLRGEQSAWKMQEMWMDKKAQRKATPAWTAEGGDDSTRSSPSPAAPSPAPAYAPSSQDYYYESATPAPAPAPARVVYEQAGGGGGGGGGNVYYEGSSQVYRATPSSAGAVSYVSKPATSSYYTTPSGATAYSSGATSRVTYSSAPTTSYVSSGASGQYYSSAAPATRVYSSGAGYSTAATPQYTTAATPQYSYSGAYGGSTAYSTPASGGYYSSGASSGARVVRYGGGGGYYY